VAIGWDTRQVGWSGDFNPGGPIVLKGSGWKGFETNPPPRTPADKIYEKGEPGLTMPRVISDAKPRYTREAMRARIEGSVTLSAVVEVDGTVGEVKVLASLHPDLDQQAILAARNWRFEPGRKDGKPVPVQVTLDMTFTLK
jgi:TonB family protein